MSAIIGGLIPKIEGFQPIPNAVMIPFMEAQSAALAYGFGLNYEYGKRKIRSMSNEQYNSLTSEDITNMSNEHTHIILSKFQAMVPLVMPMQQEIFKQYVIIEKAKVQQNFELAKWMLSFIKEIADDTLAHAMGGHLHGEILEPYITPPGKFINPITGEQGAQPTPGPSAPPPPSTISPPTTPFTGQEDYKQPVAIEWVIRRDQLIKEMHRQKLNLTRKPDSIAVKANFARAKQELTKMSNDFRHPNNFIRSQALILRQLIANGLFK